VREDWISKYLRYASITEAPKKFHFWTAVSVLSGTVRNHIWFDQIRFKWTPSFYIILVAKPGIAQKSTTVDIGYRLLGQVPGIHIGPDSITWQRLVSLFSELQESQEFNGELKMTSQLSIGSSELGVMLDVQDNSMLALLVTLWDGRERFEKQTKMNGNEIIENPWLSMIACTTEQWIKSNVSKAMMNGGFISRCIFTYADRKEKLIPLLDEVSFENDEVLAKELVKDLEHIAMNVKGQMKLTDEARKWMHKWYENIWKDEENSLDNQSARLQAHLVKLAMILSISRSDDLTITEDDFKLADIMIKESRQDAEIVLKNAGTSEDSQNVDMFCAFVKAHPDCTFEEAYRFIQPHFIDMKNFSGILLGLVESKRIMIKNENGKRKLRYIE